MSTLFSAQDFLKLPEASQLMHRIADLEGQSFHKELVFVGVYGSHLYGLHRNGSDVDVKGVYLPTLSAVVFGQHKETIERQSGEFDSTFYSVQKLISCLARADIVTMDMIHTDVEHTIQASSLWFKLRKLRSNIYTKDMRGILGYIKTQTAKYGHKVGRVEELRRFRSIIVDVMNKIDPERVGMIINETDLHHIVQHEDFKFIQYVSPSFTEVTQQPIQEAIEICGKKYQTSAQISYMLDGIDRMLGQYGSRVETAIKSGGDWKALSHSLRGIIQLEEIIETGDLKFPLKRAPEIMKVKLGEISADVAAGLVTEGCDRVTEKLEKSGFPEKPNMEPMMDVIMDHYLK